jgi:hypothetical protein
MATKTRPFLLILKKRFVQNFNVIFAAPPQQLAKKKSLSTRTVGKTG